MNYLRKHVTWREFGTGGLSRDTFIKGIIFTVVGILCVSALFFAPKLLPPLSVTVPGAVTLPRDNSNAAPTSTASVVPPPKLSQYIEVVDGCGPYYATGECVNVRSGPGTNFPVVARLRTGVVLRAEDVVSGDGRTWYKVMFAHELLYPERVKGDWYVATDVVHVISIDGDESLTKGQVSSTTKRIVVDISEEMLYAYDGDILFMREPISTGLEFTPTPRGTFLVFKMTPSRFMQGPIPGVSEQVYDLPGVPWNLYFTNEGAVIHGAYWHDHFGKPWSHGCVNLPPQEAKKLYFWADIGTKVTVKG